MTYSFSAPLIKFIDFRLKIVNKKNKKRLNRSGFSLISSNCTGGFLSNWLGLEFKTPFINLFMNNQDFLTAMENFDEFINSTIQEYKENQNSYPIGIGIHGEKIYFSHYPDFKTAIEYWEKRKKRIDRNNMIIMLSNLGCGIEAPDKTEKEIYNEELEILKRFNNLTFKNKIAFSGFDFKLPNVVYIKGYSDLPGHHLFELNKKSFFKRYIDQFDYVNYFNSIMK